MGRLVKTKYGWKSKSDIVTMGLKELGNATIPHRGAAIPSAPSSLKSCEECGWDEFDENGYCQQCGSSFLPVTRKKELTGSETTTSDMDNERPFTNPNFRKTVGEGNTGMKKALNSAVWEMIDNGSSIEERVNTLEISRMCEWRHRVKYGRFRNGKYDERRRN